MPLSSILDFYRLVDIVLTIDMHKSIASRRFERSRHERKWASRTIPAQTARRPQSVLPLLCLARNRHTPDLSDATFCPRAAELQNTKDFFLTKTKHDFSPPEGIISACSVVGTVPTPLPRTSSSCACHGRPVHVTSASFYTPPIIISTDWMSGE